MRRHRHHHQSSSSSRVFRLVPSIWSAHSLRRESCKGDRRPPAYQPSNLGTPLRSTTSFVPDHAHATHRKHRYLLRRTCPSDETVLSYQSTRRLSVNPFLPNDILAITYSHRHQLNQARHPLLNSTSASSDFGTSFTTSSSALCTLPKGRPIPTRTYLDIT